MNIKNSIFIAIILITGLTMCRKSEYLSEHTETISDQGGGTGTTTWTSDKSYLISGFVFVNDGQVLTIEAGTVIRAKAGQGTLASALIVSRGGRIIAEGTNTEPIIFTAEADDLSGSVPLKTKGLWGGLILLGNAVINTESGEDLIEGIPISEPRGVYGGIDDDDNSGILRYVSIRHGGTNIGEGNEINGLTLGGVGRQTIIDHVEVISNVDDGVEVFGGSVNLRNIVVSFCGDDSFDFDQGYHGKCQFLLALDNEESDKAIECSGGLEPLALIRSNFPTLYNLTIFGEKYNESDPVIEFSSFGSAFINNSIFIDAGKGIAVQNKNVPGDPYSLFENGEMGINNNIFSMDNEEAPLIYCYDDAGSSFPVENQLLADSLMAWHNIKGQPLSQAGGTYQILPSSTVFDNMASYDNPWYEVVTYKGAFGADNWLEGWTLIQTSGLIIDNM
jgi:hypothetical protein